MNDPKHCGPSHESIPIQDLRESLQNQLAVVKHALDAIDLSNPRYLDLQAVMTLKEDLEKTLDHKSALHKAGERTDSSLQGALEICHSACVFYEGYRGMVRGAHHYGSEHPRLAHYDMTGVHENITRDVICALEDCRDYLSENPPDRIVFSR